MTIISLKGIFNQDIHSNKSKDSKLGTARKKKGWSQQKLSDESNVSMGMIQKYEQNKSNLKNNLPRAQLFADILGIDVNELI